MAPSAVFRDGISGIRFEFNMMKVAQFATHTNFYRYAQIDALHHYDEWIAKHNEACDF